MGMDSNCSNCYSTLFGPKQNRRVYLLEELIANNNLIIENIGHKPTYESWSNPMCIDVTISMNLKQVIHGWKVDRAYYNYIKFSLQADEINIPLVWQWHKVDWETFKQEMKRLDYKILLVINQGHCEEMFCKLYEYLNRGMRKAIPRSKAKTVDKNNL